MAYDRNNTHLARIAKRQRRRKGDLAGMRARLWRAVEAAEACLLDAAVVGDRGGVLKAVHALTQASGAYAKLLEVGELEARLGAIEAALKAQAETPARADPARGFTTTGAAA